MFTFGIVVFVTVICCAQITHGQECMSCHKKPLTVKQADGSEKSIQVNEDALNESVHAKLDCVDCHTKKGDLPHPGDIATKNCQYCHIRENIVYKNSVHSKVKNSGQPRATCTNCHGIHEAKSLNYISHPEYKKLIVETCGNCHRSIFDEFNLSVHGKAIAENILDAPVCTDCHGEHAIAAVGSAESKVSKMKLPKTCSSCHDQEKLVKKYRLPGKRFETYYDSYHGIENKYGESFVANCASCHGTHKILPSSDPESSTNVNNLIVTCGKCHPNANENFTRGKVHVRAAKEVSFGVYVVRQFYTWFILILMILFVSHITADIVRSVKRKRRDA